MIAGLRIFKPLLCRNLLALLLCLSPTARALAEGLPNWERSEALRAAAAGDNQQEVQLWLNQIDSGQAAEVLQALQSSEAAGSPAFEAQLHSLALFLAEAPLDAANDQLLAWLENYPSAVLVAHEESATYAVPLFPVAAAAKGSRTEWQRRMAEQEANTLPADPQRWIDAYLAADPAEQQGMEQALHAASPDALAGLAGRLQIQLPAQPQLAMPAGIVAGSLADEQLFLAAVQQSQGAATVEVLRLASWRLDSAQRSQLLNALLAPHLTETPATPRAESTAETGEAPTAEPAAALGIALLAPGLHSNPTISQHLLELLDDQELGAAAALALAGHPDSKVQAALQGKLHGGGLEAQRAALALDHPLPNSQIPAEGSDQP